MPAVAQADRPKRMKPSRSEWDEIEAVQVAENGVNVALTFSRYNADGEVVSTFNTLYLVTNDNGRWVFLPALASLPIELSAPSG